MKLLLYLSNVVLPLLLCFIVSYGLYKKQPVYEQFLKGAKEGCMTVVKILPTLIGLMVAVGVLRGSGFLDMLGNVLGNFSEKICFPAPLVPVALVKMFSSSAATGLVLDLFEIYGPDSYYGKIASIMGSCTETIFYTMSVYYMSVGIKKTRWTLPGALIATVAGIIASVILAKYM